MAIIEMVNPNTIRIHASIADAMIMIREAASDVPKYADEILKIFENMPAFDYTYFCFYAYDSANLFEGMLGVDPKRFTSFSMEGSDAFFFALYGGMGGLYEQAKRYCKTGIVSLEVMEY